MHKHMARKNAAIFLTPTTLKFLFMQSPSVTTNSAFQILPNTNNHTLSFYIFQ